MTLAMSGYLPISQVIKKQPKVDLPILGGVEIDKNPTHHLLVTASRQQWFSVAFVLVDKIAFQGLRSNSTYKR